jgi:hypothetical protein
MSDNIIYASQAFLQNRISKDLRFLMCLINDPYELLEAERAYRQDRSVIVRHAVRKTPWTESYLRENNLLVDELPFWP